MVTKRLGRCGLRNSSVPPYPEHLRESLTQPDNYAMHQGGQVNTCVPRPFGYYLIPRRCGWPQTVDFLKTRIGNFVKTTSSIISIISLSLNGLHIYPSIPEAMTSSWSETAAFAVIAIIGV